jgi:putative transcriptional regulator
VDDGLLRSPDRGMTLTELADSVGVLMVNLSVLENGRAKALRCSTITAIGEALECRPGDVLGLSR